MADQVRTTYGGVPANAGLMLVAGTAPAAAAAMPGGALANPSYVYGSRIITPVKGTIPNGTSAYGANACIGGLVAISTGLPGGTILNNGNFRLRARFADYGTTVQFNYTVFDANPTASTYTDLTTASLAFADLQKAILLSSGAATGVAGSIVQTLINLPRLTLDGSGNFYIAVVANASVTFSAVNILAYEFDGTY